MVIEILSINSHIQNFVNNFLLSITVENFTTFWNVQKSFCLTWVANHLNYEKKKKRFALAQHFTLYTNYIIQSIPLELAVTQIEATIKRCTEIFFARQKKTEVTIEKSSISWLFLIKMQLIYCSFHKVHAQMQYFI